MEIHSLNYTKYVATWTIYRCRKIDTEGKQAITGGESPPVKSENNAQITNGTTDCLSWSSESAGPGAADSTAE
ncbi:hypothetical protein GCM10027291_02750 [Telluribacter humicola]